MRATNLLTRHRRSQGRPDPDPGPATPATFLERVRAAVALQAVEILGRGGASAEQRAAAMGVLANPDAHGPRIAQVVVALVDDVATLDDDDALEQRVGEALILGVP